jgi:hypothetical protein
MMRNEGEGRKAAVRIVVSGSKIGTQKKEFCEVAQRANRAAMRSLTRLTNKIVFERELQFSRVFWLSHRIDSG